MKTHLRLLFIILFLALLISAPVQAQTTVTNAKPGADSLSFLPESESIVYVNISSILNDAMPRLVPEKELKDIRAGLDQMKAFTNVDLRNLEFVVIAARFNKPSGGTLFPIPEAMFAARGDFDAKALLGMATMMSGGKLREEKYGEHTLQVLKLSEISDGAAKNPFTSAFSEIAISTLDGNTIAIGTIGYIKAAFDAADGRGRIKPETIASLLRDPNALISVSGSPLTAFAKSLGLRMADNRDSNCTTKFGDFNLSLIMAAQDFKIVGAMNADNPDTAGIVKNMLNGLLQQGRSFVPDKNAQTLFDQVKLIVEGSEVVVEATIPQEMAARFMRDTFAPKPPTPTIVPKKESAPAVEEKKVTKPKSKSRRSRRKV